MGSAAAPTLDGAPIGEPAGDGAALADVERRHVLRVLETTDGNRQATAKILGISRRTLLRMLQRWGVVAPKQ